MSNFFWPKLKFLCLILFVPQGCAGPDLEISSKTAATQPLKLLDSNALTINDFIIFESDIRLLMKILKDNSEDLKKPLKEFREQAIEQLTEEALYLFAWQREMQENYRKMLSEGHQRFNSEQEEREFQEILFHSKNINRIANYIIKSNHGQGDSQEESFTAFLNQQHQEATAKGYTPDLYFSYICRRELIAQLKNQEASRYKNSVILLPSQIDKEVTDIIKQLLTTGEFELQILRKALPSNCTPQQSEVIKEELAQKLAQTENSLSGFENLIAETMGDPHYGYRTNSLIKMRWNQLPPLLQKDIKKFENGQIFGPIRDGKEIKIFRIHQINIPYCTQMVKKYTIRKIFNRASALETNGTIRRKMNSWSRAILNKRQSFEEIAREHSEDLISAERGGLISDLPLEEITEDPKVQHAIEQLTLENSLSLPILGGDGWYLINLENVREESIDAREVSSLKARARAQLLAKGQEEFLKKHFAELKKNSTIHRFDEESNALLNL